MSVNAAHRRWLLELTGLPTAAGREGRVVAWVERWVARRPHLALRRSRFGNLIITRRGARSAKPIYFTAHLDHPAFVVSEVLSPRLLRAEFRGAVADEYFVGSPVRLHPRQGGPARGKVVGLEPIASPRALGKTALARFSRSVSATVGDVLTWDVGRPRLVGDRLHAPACDDLAGVAAALAALDVLGRRNTHVRVLLTRAEEVGFIGALAAARAGDIPGSARLICLENSKSYAESPLGGGPIVRVGDRTSTFDPDLTYRLSEIAAGIARDDPSFQWQRKLMAGGTCEASAFCAMGYAATCLCLPLGNYHNMRPRAEGARRGKIAAETISLSDFTGLVRLLVATARAFDVPSRSRPLRAMLDDLYERRAHILGE